MTEPIISPDGTKEWDGEGWVDRQSTSTRGWTPLPTRPTSRRRWLVIGSVSLVAAMAVVVAVVVTGAVSPAPTINVRGEITLKASEAATPVPSVGTAYNEKFLVLAGGQNCTGWHGFDDIAEGAAVTVRDDSDHIIGDGKLRSGVFDGKQECALHFFIDGLPDRPYYQVEVTHRGRVTVSRADLINSGVHLTL